MAFFLFACQNKLEKKSDQKTLNNKEISNNIIETCNFDRFLKDVSVPEIAKKLYNDTYKLKNDEPLILLEKLKSNNKEERMFYFRVITNSYKISDGAYSESLGNIGKEYVENKTNEFVEYFDNKECFTDEDLETWADIVLLEIQLEQDNVEKTKEEHIIYGYCRKLKKQSENYPATQKVTISKFTKILETKWGEFLKHI